MTDGMRDCPICGESIKASALKCRFCNEDLQAFQAKQDYAVEREIFSGHPAAVYSVGHYFGIVLTVGLAGLVLWLRSKSTSYTITTQRIKIEKGIFSKSKNNIELFRIDDFDVVRPLGMRMLGFGILDVKSSDRNVSDIRIVGLKDVEALYENLRECSLRERERRGVKVWANA